jgi:HSP20 family protein
MKTLEKTTQSSMTRVIEDFWNKDGFLDESMKMEPTINIIDRNGVYKVRVSAPGFKKKDFKVAVEDGSLIISAEKRIEKKKKRKILSEKSFLLPHFPAVSTSLRTSRWDI